MMRSGNPALNANTFKLGSVSESEAMTIQGTVNKSAISLLILLATASWTWGKAFAGGLPPALWISVLAAFIVSLIVIFKKEWSPFLVPVYAGLEGIVIGAVSAVFEIQFPGIVIQAVSLTFGTLFALLFAYKSGLIRPSENFKLGIVAATGGIALVYFLDIILMFFKIRMPFIHESGPLGIAFSLFVVVIAALNLVLDFDFIEQGAANRVPKYMEWYGAFGLMITLVWLYLEILRLLAKMRDRR